MRGGEHILDALKKAKQMVDSGESRMMVAGAMNTTTFMVGEAHSKLHSEMCQVLYGPHYSTVSGMETGEEAEQANAFLSRLVNSRTRSRIGSTEVITEFASHMCDTKINAMPKTLSTRHKNAAKKLRERELAFKDMHAQAERQHGVTIDMMQCIHQTRIVAERVEAKTSNAESDALEYFRIFAHVSQVRTLQPFVDYTLGSMEDSTSARGQQANEVDKTMVDVLSHLLADIKATHGGGRLPNMVVNDATSTLEDEHDEGGVGEISTHLATLRAHSKDLLKGLPKQEEELRKLEHKLRKQYRIEGGSEDANVLLLRRGRHEVGEAVMHSLQDRLEALQLGIVRLEDNAQRRGATAKQKAKYIQKMGVRAKEARALVAKYNVIVSDFPKSGYKPTTFDDIKQNNFQWTEPRAAKHIDDRHTPLVHQLGMKRCMLLVEAYSKKMSCRERVENPTTGNACLPKLLPRKGARVYGAFIQL